MNTPKIYLKKETHKDRTGIPYYGTAGKRNTGPVPKPYKTCLRYLLDRKSSATTTATKSMAQPTTHEATQTVEFHINLPSFSDLIRPVKTIRIRTIVIIGICIAVAAGMLTINYVTHRQYPSTNPRPTMVSPSQTSTKSVPSYPTLLPAGKSIGQLGGWGRVSPPNRNPVYAFSDKIGNVQIDVSEQPLPASFQTNTTDQIAQLAKSYTANDQVNANGTLVYIGTSANGPQSVILSKHNLLILIKSASPATDRQWATYVESLQ